MIKVNNATEAARVVTDKIVHVKVMARKGNEVEIELNGTRVKARLDTNVPDSFLALVEKQGNELRLRPIERFLQSNEFSARTIQILTEKAQQFLLENHLPLQMLKTALLMLKAGLPLQEKVLRFLYGQGQKLSSENLAVLLPLIKKGFLPDKEEIDFILNLKEIIRFILKETKRRTENSVNKKTKKNIFALISHWLGSPYEAQLVQKQNRNLLIEIKEETKGEKRHFRIEATDKNGESLCLSVLWGESSVECEVFAETTFYHSIQEAWKQNFPRLKQKLQKMLYGKRIVVSLLKTVQKKHLFSLTDRIKPIPNGLEIYA